MNEGRYIKRFECSGRVEKCYIEEPVNSSVVYNTSYDVKYCQTMLLCCLTHPNMSCHRQNLGTLSKENKRQRSFSLQFYGDSHCSDSHNLTIINTVTQQAGAQCCCSNLHLNKI